MGISTSYVPGILSLTSTGETASLQVAVSFPLPASLVSKYAKISFSLICTSTFLTVSWDLRSL